MFERERDPQGVMPSSGIKAIGSTDAGRAPTKAVHVDTAPPVDQQAQRAGGAASQRFVDLRARLARSFCYRVYRRASLMSRRLRRWGAPAWVEDLVYRLLPLRLCKIGFDVWDAEHRKDLDSFLQGGQP